MIDGDSSLIVYFESHKQTISRIYKIKLRKVDTRPSNLFDGIKRIVLVYGKGISNFSFVRPLNIEKPVK